MSLGTSLLRAPISEMTYTVSSGTLNSTIHTYILFMILNSNVLVLRVSALITSPIGILCGIYNNCTCFKSMATRCRVFAVFCYVYQIWK